jgi:hypothetical protein
MKIIVAVQNSDAYHYEVLLDESKADKKGVPDPAWVRNYDWPLSMDKADILSQMQALAEDELAHQSAQPEVPVVLPEQGQQLEVAVAAAAAEIEVAPDEGVTPSESEPA